MNSFVELRRASLKSHGSDRCNLNIVYLLNFTDVDNPRFIFDVRKLPSKLPMSKLYLDFVLSKEKTVDLSDWRMDDNICEQICKKCRTVDVLSLNSCLNLKSSHIQNFHIMSYLRKLSIRGSISLDEASAKAISGIASNLIMLDISENKTCFKGIITLFKSCKRLKILVAENLEGLDDIGMKAIGKCIETFNSIESLNFNYCKDFSDDGLLSVLNFSSFPIVSYLSLKGCNNLTQLAFTGLSIQSPSSSNVLGRRPSFSPFASKRKLKYLDISYTCIPGRYDWISYGCYELETLICNNCDDLKDLDLALLGEGCPNLLVINISYCSQITDEGLSNFFLNFRGKLKSLDISGCLQCSNASLIISNHCKYLEELKMNYHRNVKESSLCTLFKELETLEVFEYDADAKTVSKDRRSIIPHISNDCLIDAQFARTIKKFSINGAYQITDEGMVPFLSESTMLTSLNVSNCFQLTDDSFNQISLSCCHIKYLMLSGCYHITDNGFASIVKSCISLISLNVSGCHQITDNGLKALNPQSKYLENLNISGLNMITDESIEFIAPILINLKYLHINGLHSVTKKSLSVIVRYCQNLRQLSCERCDIPSRMYSYTVNNHLPLSKASLGLCQLEPLSKQLVAHNEYVLKFRMKKRACITLQRWYRRLRNDLSL